MNETRKIYNYVGPVMRFDRCIENNWNASTYACSERQALNNLKYRYRKTHNLARNSDVSLPGKIMVIT